MKAQTQTQTATRAFWHAHLSTSHFTFDAYGQTEAEARDALKRGIRVHVHQTDASPKYMREALEDANVTRVEMGSCWRDRDSQLV